MRGGVAVCLFGVRFVTGVEDAFTATSFAFATVIGLAATLARWTSGIGAAPNIFVFDVLQGVHAGTCFTNGGIVDESEARPMTGWLTKAINQRTVATADTALHIAQSRVGAAVAHILRNAHHHVIARRTVGIERLLLSDALAVAIVESGHLIFSFIIAASERKTGDLFTASCALIASCSASSEGVSPRRRATP